MLLTMAMRLLLMMMRLVVAVVALVAVVVMVVVVGAELFTAESLRTTGDSVRAIIDQIRVSVRRLNRSNVNGLASFVRLIRATPTRSRKSRHRSLATQLAGPTSAAHKAQPVRGHLSSGSTPGNPFAAVVCWLAPQCHWRDGSARLEDNPARHIRLASGAASASCAVGSCASGARERMQIRLGAASRPTISGASSPSSGLAVCLAAWLPGCLAAWPAGRQEEARRILRRKAAAKLDGPQRAWGAGGS